MQTVINRINELVQNTNATDFNVHAFDRDNLLLTASFDHCYYHEFEVHFYGVSYIELPVYCIRTPRFSIANDSIRRLYSYLDLDIDELLFEVHQDFKFGDGHRFHVAARQIELIEGMVYYYQRENLKPGERIADWVGNDR